MLQEKQSQLLIDKGSWTPLKCLTEMIKTQSNRLTFWQPASEWAVVAQFYLGKKALSKTYEAICLSLYCSKNDNTIPLLIHSLSHLDFKMVCIEKIFRRKLHTSLTSAIFSVQRINMVLPRFKKVSGDTHWWT